MIKIKIFIILSMSMVCCVAEKENLYTVPRLVIDNDAGSDDAVAIFLTLLTEKHFKGPKLVGLTTVNGNTKEDNVAINNQRILKAARRQDVPIFRGSKQSLVITPIDWSYYGEDGLGDVGEQIEDLIPTSSTGAVMKLIELSKTYEGQLIVATLGTLTNIALAISIDPNFLGRLKQLYIGAGHIYGGNFSSFIEFNAHMDVEAYHKITKHATPDKVTILPFSQVMTDLHISSQWRSEILGGIRTDIVTAMNSYERKYLSNRETWHALDPAVIALLSRPDLVNEYKYSKHGIILCGKGRGKNTNMFVEESDANVRIIHSIKTEEYKQYLFEVFSADGNYKP